MKNRRCDGTVLNMSVPAVLSKALLPVAGVSFYQDHVRGVQVGDQVRVRHDYSNPHDSWAVAVRDSNGNMLGYVSAKGGLAARISQSSPGGEWDATVAEVLPGDITGLRIQLGQLRAQHDTTVGSDRPGWRDESTDTPLPSDHTEDPEVVKQAAAAVFTRSGRHLGTLIGPTASGVRVMGPGGQIQTWPRSVVDIRET